MTNTTRRQPYSDSGTMLRHWRDDHQCSPEATLPAMSPTTMRNTKYPPCLSIRTCALYPCFSPILYPCFLKSTVYPKRKAQVRCGLFSSRRASSPCEEQGGKYRSAHIPAPSASRFTAVKPVPPCPGDNRPSMRVGLSALHLRARLPTLPALLYPITRTILTDCLWNMFVPI